jgi:hypothetical protein
MLEMMKGSESIEEAMCKIVRKCEFAAKIFLRTSADYDERGEFAHRLIRNYSLGTGTYNRPFRMQNIDSIISLEPKSESHYIMDQLMMRLYPQLLTNTDLRDDFLSHSLFNDLDWLAPLIVFTDYFSYY